MLAKYIGNPSASDRTEIIKLAVMDGKSRSLVLGGPAVEITAQEYYGILANGYQIELLDEETGSDTQQQEVAAEVTQEPETDDEVEPSGTEYTDMTQSYGASPTSPFGA